MDDTKQKARGLAERWKVMKTQRDNQLTTTNTEIRAIARQRYAALCYKTVQRMIREGRSDVFIVAAQQKAASHYADARKLSSDA